MLPRELPAAALDLGPAESAQGTCAWYAALLTGVDRGALPDRAVGALTAPHARGESCTLAVSPGESERILRGLTEQERAAATTTRGHWWIRTQSYFGDEARGTYVGQTSAPIPVVERKAGRVRGDVLFGSATCQGRPAAFTMQADPQYGAVLKPRLAELFKAYATDTATRRGCTDLTLPG